MRDVSGTHRYVGSELVTIGTKTRRRWLRRGEVPQTVPARTWLPPLDYRLTFPAVAIALLVAWFYPFDGAMLNDEPWESVLLSLVCLYVGVVVFRCRLELHDDALYVWTLTRVRRLPVDEIAGVRAGDDGLYVTLRSGEEVITWLIGQKIRPERKRHTRADRLAAEVAATVTVAHADLAQPDPR